MLSRLIHEVIQYMVPQEHISINFAIVGNILFIICYLPNVVCFNDSDKFTSVLQKLEH